MADLLTALKSVRSQADPRAPDRALTAVKSTATNGAGNNPAVKVSNLGSDEGASFLASSPEDALQLLRSRPDLNQFLAILDQLHQHTFPSGPFSLHLPAPLQTQIIKNLVVDIFPDFWTILSGRQRAALTACLQNVTGMNAVMLRLRQLSLQRDIKNDKSTQLIPELIRLSELLFAGDHALSTVYQGLEGNLTNSIKRDMAVKELVNLVSSGKVSSTIAQAEDAIKAKTQCWLSKGNAYNAWLGRNIATLANISHDLDGTTPAAQLLARAISLGHPSSLLSGFFQNVLHTGGRESDSPDVLRSLLLKLPAHAKRAFTEHFLRWICSRCSQAVHTDSGENAVPAVAACLSLLNQDSQIKQHLTAFLTDPALSASLSLPVRRAAALVLSRSDDTDDLYRVLEKLISTFSDRLFIDHASNAQQDSLVQTILILSGYLHRRKPVAFLVLGRSSGAIHGVSNRLDSSNSRARWLGMVFGTAVSQLLDKEGSRMNFGTDELDSEEATWYLRLVRAEDTIGSLRDFSNFLDAALTQDSQSPTSMPIRQSEKQTRLTKQDTLNSKPIFGPPRPPAQTEIIGERVTEILDDGTNEEEDLKPYANPDSDPEDSDEDATMVNRRKVKPPVYIRDLMSMLRDDQNHVRFQMGLKHAATLIRRKAKFGAEVKDHAEELSSIVCNLQDPFETESFEQLKISALVAMILADVQVIAPRLCQQAFCGDYSLAQRCIILSALGLCGRELSGFVNEDALNPVPAHTAFPTKQLPPRLHSIYASVGLATKKLDAASADMERQLIQPIAVRAADQSTAHLDAVKVRTFSSRMAVERTKRKPAPNQLAKVFGENFFFPLINGYQQEISAYGTASVYASAPFLLVTYLKTLALLFHASGPPTFGLPQVTAEFWDLLLSLRGQALSDLAVLQAVLFSLLAMLEVNVDNKRQLVQDLPRQLMETQQWVDLVFEQTGGGSLINEQKDDDENKVRTLAAGVLVKIKEIIDAYQQQLIGYMP